MTSERDDAREVLNKPSSPEYYIRVRHCPDQSHPILVSLSANIVIRGLSAGGLADAIRSDFVDELVTVDTVRILDSELQGYRRIRSGE